jgi:hypothetical protein
MAATLSTEFREQTIEIRGVKYVLRELSATEYDDLVKIATGPDDEVDLTALLKLMMSKCLIDPKLSAEELGNKPYPVVRKLNETVNRLHFGDVEGEE